MNSMHFGFPRKAALSVSGHRRPVADDAVALRRVPRCCGRSPCTDRVHPAGGHGDGRSARAAHRQRAPDAVPAARRADLAGASTAAARCTCTVRAAKASSRPDGASCSTTRRSIASTPTTWCAASVPSLSVVTTATVSALASTIARLNRLSSPSTPHRPRSGSIAQAPGKHTSARNWRSCCSACAPTAAPMRGSTRPPISRSSKPPRCSSACAMSGALVITLSPRPAGSAAATALLVEPASISRRCPGCSRATAANASARLRSACSP